MSAAGFVRIAKPAGTGIILAAARHNKRTIRAEPSGSIDPVRSRLNYRLAGPESPEAVAQLANSLMKEVGVGKLRKNAVRAIELVFSLPHDTTINLMAYFADCLRWAGDRFGGPENVLSADVHLDEAAPHCHVLMLPLVGGRMLGSDLVGGPKVLAGHLTSFHEAVASRHGLRRPPPRLSTPDRQMLAAAVLRRLQETADAALRSVTWAVTRDAIERDPVPWAATLGVAVGGRTATPMKSMTAIFTSPGKGPKKEREPSNPLWFGVGADDQTLCPVGFARKTAADDAHAPEPAEPPQALVAS